MKLLTKTTLWYAACLGVLLIVTGFALFYVLAREVSDEMNEQLLLEAEAVKADLRQGIYARSHLVRVDTVHGRNAVSNPVFTDTLVYDSNQKKHENYRLLTVVDSINGKPYRIQVMDSHIGADNYLHTIFRIFLVMALVFVVAAIAINYMLSKQIWRPFFANLRSVKNYSIKSKSPLQLQSSDIKEFEELKAVIEDSANRSRQEYNSLHEFTENASHEIQTPLAIILAKLNRLSQGDINRETATQLQMARAAAERLSRTNKNLLLLAKVENDVYEREALDFSFLVETQLRQMEELFSLHGLFLERQIAYGISIRGNAHLCEILLSNLLANALQHSPKEGNITIFLDERELVISNPGQPLPFDRERLFQRFVHGGTDKGTGLGLAIVREICRLHGWLLTYDYRQEQHVFALLFQPTIS